LALGVRLVYYVFDLLHLDGCDIAALPLIDRKALLEPLIAQSDGLQFNAHETGDDELIRQHACKRGFEGVVSKTIDAPYAPGNRGLWRKTKCLNRQEFVAVGWTDPEDHGPTSARSCSATTLTTVLLGEFGALRSDIVRATAGQSERGTKVEARVRLQPAQKTQSTRLWLQRWRPG